MGGRGGFQNKFLQKYNVMYWYLYSTEMLSSLPQRWFFEKECANVRWVQDVTRKASVSDTTSAGMHIGPFSPFTWFTESLLPGPVTIRNTFIDISGQQFLGEAGFKINFCKNIMWCIGIYTPLKCYPAFLNGGFSKKNVPTSLTLWRC
jgi:hypothetical protein